MENTINKIQDDLKIEIQGKKTIGYIKVFDEKDSFESQKKQLKESGCDCFIEEKNLSETKILKKIIEESSPGQVIRMVSIENSSCNQNQFLKFIKEAWDKQVRFSFLNFPSLDLQKDSQYKEFISFLFLLEGQNGKSKGEKIKSSIMKKPATKRTKLTQNEIDAFLEDYDEGMTTPEIFKKHKIGASTLYYFLKKRKEKMAKEIGGK